MTRAYTRNYVEGVPCPLGHTLRYARNNICVECRKIAAKRQWGKIDIRAHSRRIKEWRNTNPLSQLIIGARKGAKNRGLVFAITANDLYIPENCPCCGVVLARFSGQSSFGPQPSIDRLDSARGYEPDNVAIICWRCNSIKRDATADELERIAAWMRAQTNRLKAAAD